MQNDYDSYIDDLLGRAQVPIDNDGIRTFVTGSTVLVVGAGGSIGAEIAKQVADLQPGRLVLLDRDETHLHDVSIDVSPAPTDLVLADIRDANPIVAVMNDIEPDVVFHAAAHKHVPLLEAHPTEAAHTNVLGTYNVVAAAVDVGIDRFVFISSDKAARPANILGYTKWLGEQLIRSMAPKGSRWCSVRFGNVLGSRGSVVPTFARQIAAGGPVTVTDPRMTRFFMSVHESVHLVLQAAALCEGGEIFMLDMGEPVSIFELAKKMVLLSSSLDTDITIDFTGPRPGEKLHEDLLNDNEQVRPTEHRAIARIVPTSVGVDDLETSIERLRPLIAGWRNDEVRGLMAAVVGSSLQSECESELEPYVEPI